MPPEPAPDQDAAPPGDGDGSPGSLRFQLLVGLGLLMAGAVLAVAAAGLVWMPEGPTPRQIVVGLGGLLLVDVAVLLLFGDYMLRSLVVRPVRRMAERAERIADGEHEVRLEPRGSSELRRLAASVNRMADRLIRNQRALEENVRSLDEANRALTEAKNELVRAEKMATVGRLAAGVAHEVGNPLNAIMGYLEIARRRGADGRQAGDPTADDPAAADGGGEAGAEAETAEWVEGIEHEARRIDRIVRGLLEYARPREGEASAVRPGEVVDRTVELLAAQGRLKGKEVEVEVEEDVPEIVADPHQLQQVLVNLLLNACDAVEEAGSPGRIRVEVTREAAPEVPPVGRPPRREDDPEAVDFSHARRLEAAAAGVPEPRFEAGDEVVAVRVLDDGTGLEEGEAHQLFDPFYSTKEPGRGTGLGLAVSARLVDGMGGTIRADDRPEGGAVFTVLLPRAPEEEAT